MKKISFFKGLPAKGEPHYSYDSIDFDEFLEAVKSGKWRDEVEYIRTIPDKEFRNQKKKNLPSVTVSGLFSERNQDKIIEHSGFLAVDVDDFTDKEKLLTDPYTYALFRSVSGNGLVVVMKCNPEKHKPTYEWAQSYYHAMYQIHVDGAPKNPASLRYVSYDPDLFLNKKAKTGKVMQPPKPFKKVALVLPETQLADLIKSVIDKGIDLAPDYHSYMTLAFALANGMGESGRSAFHSLCQVNSKYNTKNADKKYDEALKNHKSGGITIGSFFWMCKRAGLELPKVKKEVVISLTHSKKTGKTKEMAAKEVATLHGMDEDEALKVASEVYERAELTVNSGDDEDIIKSILHWLNTTYKIRVNLITRKIEVNDEAITDAVLNSIYLNARMYFRNEKVNKDLVRTIVESDFIDKYDPIDEFIQANRHRKASGLVDKIIDSIKSDTPKYEVFIAKWLVSIVAAYKGYPVRSVLALVGGQNTGKTEWFRRLLPGELKQYYAESKLDAGKDDEILMCEKLIVMDDEMGGKSKQDEKRFKELTSKEVFSYRAPYARHNEDRKRLAILCGTSNDSSVINDPTGNTRILPVNVISIDHALYNSVDKADLFMELLYNYEQGAEWKLNPDDIDHLSEVSTDFESMPFERELICKYFCRNSDEHQGYPEFLTSTEIKMHIEEVSKQKIISMKRFQTELSKIFGKSILKKRAGQPVRVYEVVRVTDQTPIPAVTFNPYEKEQVNDVF
jgi:predicted P-loop ATPase